MSQDVFTKYDLRKVINVSGRETAYGAAKVPDQVIRAVASILPHSVDVLDLEAAASEVVARVTGAEAGFITGCAAAGISVSVAACMAGSDLVRTEQLPDTTGLKEEVILQKGHDVNYGARVSQNIRLPGARVVEIGTATDCAEYQLRGAIGSHTGAAVFVWSHHAVMTGLLDLREFSDICHQHGVPVIVDAANEQDWPGILAMGADLLIFSAHKAAGGPTAGVIAGRAELVRACMFQERGIGRTMKCGKEAIVGAMAALELWENTDHAALRRENRVRLEKSARLLARLPGLAVRIEADVAGQPVDRLAIQVDPVDAGLTAEQLAAALSLGDTSIAIYALRAEMGKLLLDARCTDDAELEFVCARISEVVSSGPNTRPHPRPRQRHDHVLARMADWPVRRHTGRI